MRIIRIPHDGLTERILARIGLRDLGIPDEVVVSSFFRFQGRSIRGKAPIDYFMKNLEYEDSRFYPADCTIRLYIDWHIVGISWIDGAITIGTLYQMSDDTRGVFFDAYNYFPDMSKIPYPNADMVVPVNFEKRTIQLSFKSITQQQPQGLIEWVIVEPKVIDVGGEQKKGWVDNVGNEIRSPTECLEVVKRVLHSFEQRQVKFGENIFSLIDEAETRGEEFRPVVQARMRQPNDTGPSVPTVRQQPVQGPGKNPTS